MRNLGHLTPRYLFDRAGLALWQKRFPDAPWLTATAVTLLSEWMRPTDTVFEWGSGRSSVWFARRARRVVSVEHDPSWFEIVGEQLNGLGFGTEDVDRRLIQTSADRGGERRDQYVGAVDHVDDRGLDLVLVDGLHRDRCASRAVAKVRPGGLLVIDNADWYFATGSRTPANRRSQLSWSSDWAEYERKVSGWRRINTTNGVWDTSIWIRPPQDEREAGAGYE